MMHGSRNLLWLIPLLLVLGWPLYGGVVRSFLAPLEIGESEIRAARPEEPQQHFTMAGVRFFQEVAGVRQWRIDSQDLRSGDDDDQLLLDGVAAVLFRAEVVQLEIVAERGHYNAATELLELEENVRLQEVSGFVLDTPALTYDEKQGRVSSQAGVVVTSNDLRVQGRNLDYDLADGRYIISGAVRLIMP
jgi:LPS export ABC transporter protein LptC